MCSRLTRWMSGFHLPFEPTERNGNLYARGAVDDKGQVMAQVKAIESLLAADGKLPINVRILFEGEEEVGGGNCGLCGLEAGGFES